MAERQKFYITTPLYYVNDAPHIGHAYTTIAADARARFERLRGKDVFFLTGTDEHGEKIAKAAEAAGLDPKSHADKMVGKYKDAWKRLGITYDKFIRTTDGEHVKAVQAIVAKLLEKKDIYDGEYEGWYCVPDETFWTEKELKEEKKCPTCGRPLEKVREKTLFFKLSKYEKALTEHMGKDPQGNVLFPHFISPNTRWNEIAQFINQGLTDLSISRTNLKWGIPIPGHSPHVVYVWFDALINYLSAIGYPDNKEYDKWWPADLHLMGKEIVRFHAVIWPAMLLALDLPLPKMVFGHGWWTVEGQKMSKSLGNMVDPLKLADEYGVDAVRYFLMREVPFGADGDFSITAFRTRFNADLANDLGNLLHRTLTMTEKYFNGVIPTPTDEEKTFDEVSVLFRGEFEYDVFGKWIEACVERITPHEALQKIWAVIGKANKYIDQEAPWKLSKEGKTGELSGILYNVLEFLYTSAHYIYPFMPDAAQKIVDQMGISEQLEQKRGLPGPGGIKIAGSQVKKGDPIFPRLEK